MSSNWNLTIIDSLLPIDSDLFLDELKKLSDYYQWEHQGNNEFWLMDAKWRAADEDMGRLSLAFPSMRLELFKQGNYGDDQRIIDAYAGKIHVRVGEVIFPPRELWADLMEGSR